MLFGNTYIKFVILDIELRFTCGDFGPVVKYCKAPKYEQDCCCLTRIPRQNMNRIAAVLPEYHCNDIFIVSLVNFEQMITYNIIFGQSFLQKQWFQREWFLDLQHLSILVNISDQKVKEKLRCIKSIIFSDIIERRGKICWVNNYYSRTMPVAVVSL